MWRKRSEVTTGGNLTRGSTDLFLQLFVLSADSPTHHGGKVQVSWFPIVATKGSKYHASNEDLEDELLYCHLLRTISIQSRSMHDDNLQGESRAFVPFRSPSPLAHLLPTCKPFYFPRSFSSSAFFSHLLTGRQEYDQAGAKEQNTNKRNCI